MQRGAVFIYPPVDPLFCARPEMAGVKINCRVFRVCAVCRVGSVCLRILPAVAQSARRISINIDFDAENFFFIFFQQRVDRGQSVARITAGSQRNSAERSRSDPGSRLVDPVEGFFCKKIFWA